jgi:hypothetical protein
MQDIEREHPEYGKKTTMWRTYRDLYSGGEAMRGSAGSYLIQRHKEPPDIYRERLSRVFYENYIGSVIDWYAATLFRREPVLSFEGENDASKGFFSAFSEDCDRKGTALSDFFRRQLIESLVTGASYVLVDFPRSTARYHNKAEEDINGASRAYLAHYHSEHLINWSFDDEGNYEWVVLRTTQDIQDALESPDRRQETRWLYYDKENFRTYRQSSAQNGAGSIQLVDEGRHGLANQRRVPLFQLKVSDGLWLMNKAALLQLEYFNKSNALSWAITMGLFAMPVIYSNRTWSEVVGESYYLQMEPGDRFGWAEPEGQVYQLAAENLVRLKDEIYRVCYVMSQAGGGFGSNPGQSGLSKQRDYVITQEVLRAYGDAVKDTMKRILRAIEVARQDGLAIDVSGLDEFDIGDFSSELDDARKLLEMGIGSKTLRKQIFKKLAFKYLCDVRQHMKDEIAKEIDEAFEKGSAE